MLTTMLVVSFLFRRRTQVRLGPVDVNDLMWGDDASRSSSAAGSESIVAEDASTDDTLNSYLASQNERTLASSVSLPCLVPICALLSCVACASQTWHLVVGIDGLCVS